MTKLAKYCDECKHFADRYDEPKWRNVCTVGHKPRFFTPQNMSQAHNSDWGFKRRCEDFQACVEAETVNFQRLMEKHNNLHMNAKADRDCIAALEKEIAQPSMDIIRATRKQPWVWLSPEEEQQIKDHCTTIACVLKAVKAKLKEKNNE